MLRDAEREPMANGAGLQSVSRALRALELIADAGELGVTELGRRLGVHKATASRWFRRSPSAGSSNGIRRLSATGSASVWSVLPAPRSPVSTSFGRGIRCWKSWRSEPTRR